MFIKFKDCAYEQVNHCTDMHVMWARFLSCTFLICFSILLARIPTGNFYADKKFLDFMTKKKKFVWTVKIGALPICDLPVSM
jgi:hypothetical protein